MIVPTLCVVTPPRTRCVRCRGDAERHWLHSHAERGNDQGWVAHRRSPMDL